MPMPRSSLFDRWAVSYDRRSLQALAYRPVHDAILARVDDTSPSTVIDLGCGTGQLTRRLTERFPEAVVVGVDLSTGMLSKAAARLGTGSAGSHALVRADAERLPFASESVDLAVCTESFHWYRHQDTALAGLAEIVRSGGRLLIASTAMFTRLGDGLVRRVTARSGQPIQAVPPESLRRMLQRAGFDVAHQRRIPRLGFAGWPVLTDARRRAHRAAG